MLLTTRLGFADFPGAGVDAQADSQRAFILGSAAALLPTLQRTFIAVPRIKALLPSAILSIPSEHQAEMIGVMLHECSTQTFQGIVEGIDHVE